MGDSNTNTNDNFESINETTLSTTKLRQLNTNQKFHRRLSAKLNELTTNPDAQEPCPICLQTITKEARSYATNCYHTFCYECLFEWSKVKNSCPLCKCDFSSIIHSIKSLYDYKETKIQATVSNAPEISFNVGDLGIDATFNTLRNRLNTFLDTYNELNQGLYSMRYTTTTSTPPLPAPIVTYRSHEWTASRQEAPVSFRTLVYRNQWKVSLTQIENQSGTIVPITRVRESNARFYRANPALIPRLVTFLTRELQCLNSMHQLIPSLYVSVLSHSVDTLVQMITRLVREIDIKSAQFLNRISSFVRPIRYATLFQHEFYAYACSTAASTVEYDAQCVYYQDGNQVDISLYRQRQLPVARVRPITTTLISPTPQTTTNITTTTTPTIIESDDEESLIYELDNDQTSSLPQTVNQSSNIDEIILSTNSYDDDNDSVTEIFGMNSSSTSTTSTTSSLNQQEPRFIYLSDDNSSISSCEIISNSKKRRRIQRLSSTSTSTENDDVRNRPCTSGESIGRRVKREKRESSIILDEIRESHDDNDDDDDCEILDV